MKICVRCGRRKLNNLFGRCKNYMDGLDSTCKSCRAKQKKVARRDIESLLRSIFKDKLYKFDDKNFDREDFVNHFLSCRHYRRFHKAWADNKYLSYFKPTLFFDRHLDRNLELEDLDLIPHHGVTFIRICKICNKKAHLFTMYTGIKVCGSCAAELPEYNTKK